MRGEFEEWIPDGFQVKKVRRPRKNVPEWANSDRKLKARIFGPSLRRYRVAYLYWRVGWNAREVAEELKTSQECIYSIISELRKEPIG